MWALDPRNWRHFADTCEEHHAIAIGLLTPLFLWPWLIKHLTVHINEFSYVALGMSLRIVAWLVIVVLVAWLQ